MKELDCVILTKPFKDLKVGTKGTIVHVYNKHNFEVEFFDENNESIDVYTISDDYIELIYIYHMGDIVTTLVDKRAVTETGYVTIPKGSKFVVCEVYGNEGLSVEVYEEYPEVKGYIVDYFVDEVKL